MSNNVKIKDLNFQDLVDKRYKNWKQFCNENKIGYNSNPDYCKSQKDILEKYCKVKWIDKREFIIKEVYKKPQATKTKQGRQGEFATPIEELLRYLPQDTYLSMSKIMLLLGLIQQDYIDYKFNKKRCVEEIMHELNKSDFGIKNFDDNCLMKIVENFYLHSSFISESIKNKLNTLAKNNIIELKIKTKIKKNDTYRYATKKEEKLIAEAEENALLLLDRKDKKEVLLKNEYNSFNNIVKDILSGENIKIDMYFPAYKFKFVDKKKGRKLSVKSIEKLKTVLFSAYIAKVRKNLSLENNYKQIAYIESLSHKGLEKEEIVLYLNKLCDFLLCGKPYQEYYKKTKMKDKYDDKENGIPF